jgi:hypothetical protein
MVRVLSTRNMAPLLYSPKLLNMKHVVRAAVKFVNTALERRLNHRRFMNKIWMLNILI